MTAQPRQRRSSVASLIAVLGAALAVVMGTPSASFAELPPEQRADPQEGVHSLIHKAGLTRAQAEQYLDLQERSHGVDEYVRDVAGSRYAGTWLDIDGDRRLKIGLRSSSEEADAETKIATHLAERGLAAETDIVHTKFSYADLQEIQDDLSTRLEDVMRQGMLITGIDTSENKVVLEVASSISAPAADRVEVEAEESDGAAMVRASPHDTLEIKRESCVAPNCDRPLRGGVRIGTSRGCTAGYNARSRSDGKYYVLTAGHCLYNDANTWYAWTSTGSPQKIGVRHNWVLGGSGDTGIVRNWVAYWAGPPLPIAAIFVPYSFDTPNPNENYGIGGVSYSSVNLPVCLTSGFQVATGFYADCGVVTELNVQGISEGVIVRYLGRASYCSGGGASGGPIFKSNRAYGTHVGRLGACDSLYQGANGAQNLLNVNIMTR